VTKEGLDKMVIKSGGNPNELKKLLEAEGVDVEKAA